MVEGAGCKVQGAGCRVQVTGYRVLLIHTKNIGIDKHCICKLWKQRGIQTELPRLRYKSHFARKLDNC